MNPAATAQTLYWFWRARRQLGQLACRERLLDHQQKKLKRFLAGPAAAVDAFRDFKGSPLEDWPEMDKSILMGDFRSYNRLRLSVEDAWDHYNAGTAPEGYAIGASTGTSGNRGLYLVSEAERYRWLGVILSRAIPDVLRHRHRVAIVLPANSRLYDAANETGRLRLRFFDLREGIEAQLGPVATFDPTIIVAPPKMLRALAECEHRLKPERIFSGAEVLDPQDRAFIERRFGTVVREIYMATEGLFGVSCEHGTLHLVEDHVAFEFQPVEGSNSLVNPLVTDFSRKTQTMVRYRMNDLLELRQDACPCGQPSQAVSAVHGRCDDVFHLAGNDGVAIRITPDVIRNAVIGADPAITDFRVVQTGPAAVRLELPPAACAVSGKARCALDHLFEGCGARPIVETAITPLDTTGDRKLRRVLMAWKSE